MQSFPRQRYSDSLLALYGQYSEVYILDSDNLNASVKYNSIAILINAHHGQILCHLQETHNPNWVAQLCFLSNVEEKGE